MTASASPTTRLKKAEADLKNESAQMLRQIQPGSAGYAGAQEALAELEAELEAARREAGAAKTVSNASAGTLGASGGGRKGNRPVPVCLESDEDLLNMCEDVENTGVDDCLADLFRKPAARVKPETDADRCLKQLEVVLKSVGYNGKVTDAPASMLNLAFLVQARCSPEQATAALREAEARVTGAGEQFKYALAKCRRGGMEGANR